MVISERSIAWFADVALSDRASVGGKGASLGELIRADAPVPQGFCVTASTFRSYLAEVDPGGRIARDVEALRSASANDVRATCDAIRKQYFTAAMLPKLDVTLTAAYERLCKEASFSAVAVRSSATSEDSSDASFAGMQDTFLWINGAGAVKDAILRCWASLYSLESVTYRLRLAIPENEVAMAVVVQQMVDACAAGVMFTCSPLTGDRSVVVIEGAWGLGSAVVSGDVTPDRFVVNKVTGDIVRRDVSIKSVAHMADYATNTVEEKAVDPAKQNEPCLSEAQIAELLRLGKLVERHYGQSMDIEWAIDIDGRVLLLQARPETVWSKKVSEQKNTPKPSNSFAHVLNTFSASRAKP